MKAIVTGVAGFIGNHLCIKLSEIGCYVIGIDNLSTGKNIPNADESYILDLCKDPIPKIDVDAFFHVAAVARIPNSFVKPRHYYYNNVISTLNALEYCRLNGIKKFIYSSSSSCQAIDNPYSQSKYMGEQLCEMYSKIYGLDIQILRYFNVYGVGMSEGSYATVLQKFKDFDNIVIYGDGTQRRDFTHVDDVCQANLLMLNHSGFGVFDVGTGVNYSINEIAELYQKPICYNSGYVGRSETLSDISAIQSLGYTPKHNVIEWVKSWLKNES